MSTRQAAIERARACFLRACWLDVAVRKPGNVSLVSPGHGMEASMFIASAQAAAGALFEPGLGVGARIEGAVAATWAVAGCNTKLKWIVGETRTIRHAPHVRHGRGQRRGAAQIRQEVSSVHRRGVGSVAKLSTQPTRWNTSAVTSSWLFSNRNLWMVSRVPLRSFTALGPAATVGA